MAIQKINDTLPTGDSPRKVNEKINDNFTNSEHAASKLVGISRGRVVLAEDITSAYYAGLAKPITSGNIDDIKTSGIYVLFSNVSGMPVGTSGGTLTVRNGSYGSGMTTRILQTFSTIDGDSEVYRLSSPTGDAWEAWTVRKNVGYFQQTTATAPNLAVASDGSVKRTSSSIKYKEVIAKLELDNELYQKAMQVNPIIYHSKSEGDPKDWHFMSFLAEELGELEPSLTQWKTHDYNDKGEYVELEKKEAEGINLNAICAVLHATNIYQDKRIEELEQRLAALELSKVVTTKAVDK